MTLPVISEKMKHIYEAVHNHVTMKTNGALLVNGKWGSGKTHYFKNILFPKLEVETNTQAIIVSLYGATDKNSIANKVLFAYLDNRAGNGKLISSATIAKSIKNITEAVPFLNKYADLSKLFRTTGEDLFRFLPSKNLLICFDDLERMSDKISADDFMGLVNELVENRGYKVVIIANQKKIAEGIKFKEKTIEKTIEFKNDLSNIFDSIIAEYENAAFVQYMNSNKLFFLQSLNSKHSVKSKQDRLGTSFENIRTIKFAVEHFLKAFEIIHKNNDISLELHNRQLKGLWLFTLAISVEFKELDNISFENKKHLDEPTPSLSDIDFDDVIWDKDQNTEQHELEKEDEWAFREDFIKDYFVRIDESYRYFGQLYNLITAGITIDQVAFLAEVEEKYHIQNGAVKPAYEHLAKFLQLGYWNFTDEEFLQALTDLLVYAETGQFDDLISYINASFYLLPFHSQLNLSKDEVLEKVKNGVDIFMVGVVPSILTETQFEFATESIEIEQMKQLRDYIKEKLKTKSIQNNTDEKDRLELLFQNDLSSFVKEIFPKDLHLRSPDAPLFDQFDVNIIETSVNQWKPASIVDLARLFEVRYLEAGFADRLTEEIPFLMDLKNYLENNPNVDKVLSNRLIFDQLLPKLSKSIKKLEDYLPGPLDDYVIPAEQSLEENEE
ncbi:P-loop NTPase fold protein [Sphingobacterium anhuiense]|uniref:P-loop NTPase fold protein n=2 Tax=Sphingobacterium anhuiense TaxID=493780 RepID=A0ABW5YTX9_9SPHI